MTTRPVGRPFVSTLTLAAVVVLATPGVGAITDPATYAVTPTSMTRIR